jgi:hypothetical protein
VPGSPLHTSVSRSEGADRDVGLRGDSDALEGGELHAEKRRLLSACTRDGEYDDGTFRTRSPRGPIDVQGVGSAVFRHVPLRPEISESLLTTRPTVRRRYNTGHLRQTSGFCLCVFSVVRYGYATEGGRRWPGSFFSGVCLCVFSFAICDMRPKVAESGQAVTFLRNFYAINKRS